MCKQRPDQERTCRPRPRAATALATAALVASLGAGAIPARALEPRQLPTRYTVEFWTESEGLPQNFVYTLLQTRDGYIWLGTRRGLARFDGVRFVVYDDLRPGQLRDSEVRALAEGDDGSLWIGTHGGGVARLRDGVFTSYSTQDGLPSDTVTAMRKVPGGPLWIGTPAGLAAFDGERFETYTRDEGLPSANVLALHLDDDGVLWIGTGSGLASHENGAFVDHAAENAALRGTIRTIAGSARDGLWLDRVLREDAGVGYVSEGVRRYANGRVTEFTPEDGVTAGEVTALLRDPEGGALWIATVGGLTRYTDGRLEVLHDGVITEAQIPLAPLRGHRLLTAQSLMLDHEGSLWVGTRSNGLGRVRPALFSSLGDGGISSVIEDRSGTLWLASSEGLSWHRGEEAGSYPLPGGLPPGPLAHDEQGRLWVGTTDGVVWGLPGEPARHADLAPRGVSVSALFDDGVGNMWIGARSAGLYRWRDGGLTHYTREDGLAGNEIRALARDSRGGIWVGTKDGGLSRWDSGRFRNVGEAQGLPSASVSALFVDERDVVWAATRRGLARIEGDEVAVLTAANGLPANYFYQILDDGQGDFWLTFAGGIARVPRSQLDLVADAGASAVQPRIYGAEHGLRNTAMTVSFQPAAWRTRDGWLLFATGNGVGAVRPDRSTTNPFPPQVHVEEVLADGRALPLDRPVEIAAGRGDLAIQYTALSFVAPERVAFEYRLAGFDRSWIRAGPRRVAFYTNLPPGRYRFELRASNEDGVWNRDGASLEVTKLPHFYQTVWFYAACALGLALAGAGTQRARMRRLKRQARELSRRVDEAVAEMRVLRGIIPVCAWCRKIRDDADSWKEMEAYIHEHSEADFTHSICPECAQRLRESPRGGAGQRDR